MIDKPNVRPPKIADRIFEWYCRNAAIEDLHGDVEEIFYANLHRMSVRKAKFQYWLQILSLMFSYAIRKRKKKFQQNRFPSNANFVAMIRNYIKTSFRSLSKNKGFSIINVGGLSLGMTMAILIALWIYDEISADRHHSNFSTIYKVGVHRTSDGVRSTQWNVPMGLGDELQAKYPDFKNVAMSDYGGSHTLVYDGNRITKDGNFIGERAVDLFSFKILQGSKNPLADPNSIVLTKETAFALFGDENPIGKSIRMDNAVDLKVTAVIASQPFNASLKFDLLLPWKLMYKLYPGTSQYQNDWGNSSWRVFVQLNDKASSSSVNEKIRSVVANHFANDPLIRETIRPEVFIFPMEKWRLYSEFENGVNTGGTIRYVKLFAALGLAVLLIASINFMNLSTARSEKRAKEVGIRKVVGSGRHQLIGQFLSESILIAIISLGISLVAVWLALPYFNRLTDKELSLQLTDPIFWTTLVGFTLSTGLIAGSYPAFYLSSFNPVSVMKPKRGKGKGGLLPRKILVVVQFASTVGLMVATAIIYLQIQHGKDRPVGFNQHGLISVNYSADLEKNFTNLEHDLKESGAATSICKSNGDPTEIWAVQGGWQWSQPSDMMVGFNTIGTEFNYTRTLGITMTAGRDFSEEHASDSLGLIVNQAAVKRMGLKEPIGEIVKWNNVPRTIVGVIPDIQMESPFQPISPLMIVFYKGWVNRLFIRMNGELSPTEALSRMRPIFDRYNPENSFEFRFADEQFARKFSYEQLVGDLTAILTAFAVVISCLGLFGLTSFMAEQRTKEIGIRKILGATVFSLWRMLSSDFLILIVIATAIAAPFSYFGMSQWLERYQYRIQIGWWIFAIAGIFALAITLLTISYQSIKASLANPVDSLRSE